MATSADAFLADLEDLEEDFGFQGDDAGVLDHTEAGDHGMLDEGEEAGVPKISTMLRKPEFLATIDEIRLKKDEVLKAGDDDEDEEMAEVNGVNKEAEVVAGASSSSSKPPANRLLPPDDGEADLDALGDQSAAVQTSVATSTTGSAGFTEDDPEYKLVSKCNSLVREIDEEMFVLYTEVKAVFQQKFPQLENILINPFDYLSVVQRMAHTAKESRASSAAADEDGSVTLDMDLGKIDFTDILPNQLIMTMTITATHSKSAPLEPKLLERAITGCDEAFRLNEMKRDVLLYLESRMSLFCPNLATLLSASLAAKLVTAAGGLLSLSRMPAQNIMLVGQQKRAMLGLAGHANHGVLYQSDLILTAKPEHKNRAIRLVAGKAALAARCDWHRSSQLGETGAELRQSIQQAMQKHALPPPAKQKKALPKPDDIPSKKRGGKRHRAKKEKYGQTEMQKMQNRVKFGEEAEQEIAQEKMGFGLGMISVTSTKGKNMDYVGGGQLAGSNQLSTGRVKQVKAKEQQRAAAAMKRQRLAAGAGARESGMSSSLAFTPVQGIELVNPSLQNQRDVGAGKINPADRYFANSANFVNLQT